MDGPRGPRGGESKKGILDHLRNRGPALILHSFEGCEDIADGKSKNAVDALGN